MSRKAWMLPRMLQELKNYARKTYGCGQPGDHSIRVLNERSVSDGENLCSLWLVILKCISHAKTNKQTNKQTDVIQPHFKGW